MSCGADDELGKGKQPSEVLPDKHHFKHFLLSPKQLCSGTLIFGGLLHFEGSCLCCLHVQQIDMAEMEINPSAIPSFEVRYPFHA